MTSRPDKSLPIADRAAFDEFYIGHVRLFTSFGLGIVPELETVRDTVQEAFIELWNRHEAFDRAEQVRAWLYRTIHNRLLNVVRNRHVVDRHADRIREESDEADLREKVFESEVYDFLCRRIEKLPPMQQRVIWLHAEGLTNEQIAERLGIAVNTVLTHKQRARAALRGFLDTFTCTAVLFWVGVF